VAFAVLAVTVMALSINSLVVNLYVVDADKPLDAPPLGIIVTLSQMY
jgi:hypothetical protein